MRLKHILGALGVATLLSSVAPAAQAQGMMMHHHQRMMYHHRMMMHHEGMMMRHHGYHHRHHMMMHKY